MKTVSLVFAAALMTTSAVAADITKAPSAKAFLTGYPYQSTGFYWGVYTEGGGGSISATVPGVGSASLVTNQIGVGGTVGYTWGSANAFYAVEAMFGWNNFNGNIAGFAFDGPAAFEQRFKVGTPLSNFLNYLPGFPALPTVPPFPAIPGGQVATNVHPYLMAGVHEDDVSAGFGNMSNRDWRIAPAIGVGMMGQLTNGVAADVWTEVVFPQKGITIGPGLVEIGLGTQYKVGFGLYY